MTLEKTMLGFHAPKTTRSSSQAIRLSDLDTKFSGLSFKIAALRFSTLLRKFDPDQPRAEQGRWTDRYSQPIIFER
ncbi:MAG: hypothetical protein J0I29_10375 [Rhizobiales bacterium]|nr:hypothetical protein [Hyphomicrobiales bacterium]